MKVLLAMMTKEIPCLQPPPEPFRIIGTFAETIRLNEAQYFAFLPTWKMGEFSNASVLNVLGERRPR